MATVLESPRNTQRFMYPFLAPSFKVRTVVSAVLSTLVSAEAVSMIVNSSPSCDGLSPLSIEISRDESSESDVVLSGEFILSTKIIAAVMISPTANERIIISSFLVSLLRICR